MSAKVEIYTKAYCAFCQRAKELLRIKGVNFVEYNITDDQRRAVEMLQRGQQQVMPRIFINGAPIGGCAELFDLDERGELDLLLEFVTFSGESLP
jgi:glutaredoxin 3